MAKFEKTKKLTGNIHKSATIVSGKVMGPKEVKLFVGNPEEFKRVVKNYVRNYDHIDNISVYKFNRQYFVVIGNAYKKNIEKALESKNKNKLEKCEDVAKVLKALDNKFGSMDIYKENKNLYLANKEKSVFILIDDNVKNMALAKSNREFN